MSDRNFDIQINTRADLTGAKVAEQQLDQDITKARSLGEAMEELAGDSSNSQELPPKYELRDGAADVSAKSLKDESTQSKASIIVEDRQDENQSSESPELDASEESILQRLKVTLANHWSRLAEVFQELRPAGAVIREKEESASRENPNQMADAGMVSEEIGSGMIEPALPRARQEVAEDDGRSVFADTEKNRPSSSLQSDTVSSAAESPDRNHAIPELSGSDQVEATRSSGEKVRAALERNGQATVAMFNQVLEAVEEQNRSLAELERRVVELSGRIQSLKNP